MAKETYAQPYKDFAWRWKRYYRPPGAPSKEAIKYYRKYLRQATKGLSRKPRVLIFGATPELRDLCYQEKCEVTIIDLNMEMILAMSELTKYTNKEETIIKGDWCFFPFKENYYDVVLGDLVLTNVPNKLHQQFLMQIKNALSPKGCFISKMYFVPDGLAFKDFERVLENFAKAPIDFYPDKETMAMEMLVNLHNHTYIAKKHIVDLSLIPKGLKKYFKKNKFAHPNKKVNSLLNIMWEMFKPMDKTWSSCSEKELEREIKKYFKILDKHVLSDCYFEWNRITFPIWNMKNKK